MNPPDGLGIVLDGVWFLVAAAFIWGAWELWRANRMVVFFKGRSYVKGGIEKEIQKSKRIWLSAFTAAHVTDNELFKSKKIERLVLLDPNGRHIETFAPHFERKPGALKAQIETATEQARASATEVRWFNGPITPMVIGEPGSGKGWARPEIPVTRSGERPGFKVWQRSHPDLYATLVDSFESMWENAREPST